MKKILEIGMDEFKGYRTDEEQTEAKVELVVETLPEAQLIDMLLGNVWASKDYSKGGL